LNIGSLSAKLTAYDAGFSSTLAKAQKQATTFNSAVTGAVAGAAASITNSLLGSVSSGFAYISKIAEDADAVRKAAQSIGVTTDALSSLQYTASLAGLGAEEVTDSLSRMQRVLGDAAAGSTSAKASVAGLGLSLDKLLNESPIDAFGDIADALNALPTAAARASAANDIFGRSYAKLLPLLSGGSKGLREAADEAGRLGVATKQLDAENIEQFLDALTRIRAAVDGFARSGFGLIVSGIKSIYDSLAQMVPLLDLITNQVIGMGKVSNILTNLPMRLGVIAVSAPEIAGGVVEGLVGASRGADGVVREINNAVAAADAAAKAIEGIAKAQNSIGKFELPSSATSAVAGLSDVARILDGLQNDLDSLNTSKLGMVVQQLTMAGASGDELSRAVEIMNKADLTRFSNSVRDALKTPADTFREMIEQLADAVAQGFLTADQASTFAASKITGSDGGGPAQSPGLLLANSAQAQLFQFSAGKKPVEDQQLAAQKQMVATLKQIEKNTDFADDGDYSGL